MYYFIVNPQSGSGRGKIVWAKIRAELERLSVTYHAYILTGPGEAKKLAASLACKTQALTIVVVGGDGTIDEVINGLCNPLTVVPHSEIPDCEAAPLPSLSHITFSCIPTGSGNDFVRGLGLSRDPIKALHTILSPKRTTSINIGTVQAVGDTPCHSYFLVSSGIGYDAAVCDAIQVSLLKKILNLVHAGKLVYLFTALRLLLTMKRQDITVSIDHQAETVYHKTYFAAAMNLPYEGGGFRFAPAASPSDGQIDLLIAHDIPRLKVLMILPLAFSGRHLGFRGVELIRCRHASFSVSDQHPLCLHTDGEVPGYFHHISYSLLDSTLQVICE